MVVNIYSETMQQYQDAVKNHKAGRPVAFEELPTPPGYAPIPGVAVPSEDEPTENFCVTEVISTLSLYTNVSSCSRYHPRCYKCKELEYFICIIYIVQFRFCVFSIVKKTILFCQSRIHEHTCTCIPLFCTV